MDLIQHIDLFSGIGGFALAARATGFYETIAFCDINKFCCDVLRMNFGYKIPIHDNVRTLSKDLLIKYGWNEKRTTIITGGFPCQPFSSAGLQGGKDDDRYLWPEMFRIIRETGARFVIGENVAGIVDMVLPEIRSDLEGEGYRVEMFVIPAAAVGGLHRRDRVWIIAYADDKRLQGCIRWSEERFREAYELFTLSLCKDEDKLPEPKVVGGDDGIPNRVDRTKALGNAIVPQIAFIEMYIIGELNKMYEEL